MLLDVPVEELQSHVRSIERLVVLVGPGGKKVLKITVISASKVLSHRCAMVDALAVF